MFKVNVYDCQKQKIKIADTNLLLLGQVDRCMAEKLVFLPQTITWLQLGQMLSKHDSNIKVEFRPLILKHEPFVGEKKEI